MSDREGGELDPNSDVDFNTMLAELVGTELTSEQRETLEGSDRTVSKGLTTEESTTTSAVTPVESEGAAPAEAEQQEASTPDPVTTLLEKHGGDAAAALAAQIKETQEAQSLIGRQGAELGNLRPLQDKIAELEGRFAEREAAQTAPAALPWVDAQTSEAIDSMVSEQGGRSAMEWVATNRPDLIEPTIDAWVASGDPSALRYVARYEANLAAAGNAQAGEAQAATADPRLESLVVERSISTALDKAREGMSEGVWEAVKPYLTEQMGAVPETIQQMVVSPDAQTQLEGVKIVLELAKGRAIADATSKASAETQNASVEAKKKAMVATGSLRPVAEGKPLSAESSTEERTQAFHEALLATETTSVRDGLTYGNR